MIWAVYIAVSRSSSVSVAQLVLTTLRSSIAIVLHSATPRIVCLFLVDLLSCLDHLAYNAHNAVFVPFLCAYRLVLRNVVRRLGRLREDPHRVARFLYLTLLVGFPLLLHHTDRNRGVAALEAVHGFPGEVYQRHPDLGEPFRRALVCGFMVRCFVQTRNYKNTNGHATRIRQACPRPSGWYALRAERRYDVRWEELNNLDFRVFQLCVEGDGEGVEGSLCGAVVGDPWARNNRKTGGDGHEERWPTLLLHNWVQMCASKHEERTYTELKEMGEEVCHHAGNGDIVGV